VLASYRRMGWTADAEEMAALGAPEPDGDGDLAAMAAMWAWCYDVALRDLDRIDDGLVVSHHALTVGGAAAHRELCRELSLAPPASASGANGRPVGKRRERVLHDFNRSATTIDEGWRAEMTAGEIATMEESVAPTWTELEKRQLPLAGPVSA
jgi:hypothetical protein